MTEAHAPYNFIPFSNYILERYESSEIGKDNAPPAHDSTSPELHSGTITVKITAETPIFISNGQDKKQFFTDSSGRYAIPGSSLRGLIRQNVQILGFGYASGSDIYDRSMFYRTVASASGTDKDFLEEHYNDLLGVKPKPGKSKGSYASKIRAGYLHHEKIDGADSYYIVPVSRYFTCKRAEAEKYYGDSPARIIECRYTTDRFGNASPADPSTPTAAKGCIIFPGRPIQKGNCVYIIPAEPAASNQPTISVSPKSIRYYIDDLRLREKSLKSQICPDSEPSFWNLPEEGQSKPVFYLENGGNTYLGMTQFIRIPYEHTVLEGLPDTHKRSDEKRIMDYAHAMFGYADGDKAYASRVAFDDLMCTEENPAGLKVSGVLGGPQESFFSGYVCEGNNYSEDDFRLRGYKRYWLKDYSPQNFPTGNDNEKVKTTLYPLDKGVSFTGTVRFKNLQKDELGLLLWALTVDGGRQSLGMGKPEGLGRVKIAVTAIKEYAPSKMYAADSFCNPFECTTGSINDYIGCAKDYLSEWISKRTKGKKNDIMALDEIKDFFFMTKLHDSNLIDASYMTLEEHKKVSCMPTVADYRIDEESGQER